MKKSIQKIVCLCLLLAYLLSFSCQATTGLGGPVVNWSLNGRTVTVSGTGENVSIFLLNPGKTVSDLNSANSLSEFKETVNYTNVLNLGKSAEYSQTFTINTDGADNTYLLYVKDESGEFSAPIAYETERFYVSYGRASGGDGTEENPFDSIETARNHIRAMEEKTAPIEVIVKGGEYKPGSTIEFTSEDSGTAEAPITYKVADGEEFVFNASTEIDIAGTVKKVDDGNILGKVSSETARHLVEIDLNDNGVPANIADYLKYHVKGYVGKTVGIYLNDERQSVARWPNAGYGTIKNVIYDTEGNFSFTIPEADAERLSRWSKAPDMYLEGYFANDWYGEWVKVKNVDSDALTIYTATASRYEMTSKNANEGRRVAAVNLLEEIDIPGEWYIDAENMKLYYYPPHTLTDSDKLEIATAERNFINVVKANYINFEGFTFEKNANTPGNYKDESISGGIGIFIRSSDNVTVKDCTFRNIGMDGVYILTSTDIDIDSCTIYDTGLRGVFVKNSGDADNLEGCGITISNCYISDAVRDSGTNNDAGILITANCVGVTVKNNTICNMKNSAIRYGGNLHTINNNEIYNCVMDTDDAGAIYAGRSFTEYGTVIKNNYIHTYGAGFETQGAGAVFWDDQHSGNSFVGNIVDACNMKNASGIRIGGGRDNVIEGNIFVGGDAVRSADRTVSFPEEYIDGGNNKYYDEDIFQSFTKAATGVDDAYNITDEDWKSAFKTKFPDIMVNFDELRNQKKYSRANTIEGNVMTGKLSIAELMTADSTIADNAVPGDTSAFLNAADSDYRLTNDYLATLTNASDKLLTEDYDTAIGLDRDFAPSLSDRSFGLVYPFDNSSVYGDSVTLKWNKCDFANSYIYEVSDTADFSNPVASGETHVNTVDITLPDKNTKYYWRVTGVNNSRYLDYDIVCSDVYSFTFSEGIYLSSLSFNEESNTISMNVVNDSEADTTVCFVVALKDTEGNLVDARVLENQSISQSPCTVSTSFADSGDVIELYIIDSMATLVPITIKYRFVI